MYSLDLDEVFVVAIVEGLVIDDLPTKEKAFADVASVANKAIAAHRLMIMIYIELLQNSDNVATATACHTHSMMNLR